MTNKGKLGDISSILDIISLDLNMDPTPITQKLLLY
jgi:hypothetical protein